MIKQGTKIYEYEYESKPFSTVKAKIKIHTRTVEKFEDGIIYIKGTEWRIPFEEIGENYFLSKEALLMRAIRNNLKGALDITDTETIIELCKEVRSLCKRLDRLNEKADKKK